MSVYNAFTGFRASARIIGRKGRRRCTCGCGSMSTRRGLADGCSMVQGCELYIARWVKQGPFAATIATRRPATPERP